jgi:uncharacterized protein YunC (DUF1805 family)
MIYCREIKVGKKRLKAFTFPLGKANLIVIKGKKGYVMCGYLNLNTARLLGDAAIKVKGISNIKKALKAKVVSLTPQAKSLGIYKNQPIRDVLKIIA